MDLGRSAIVLDREPAALAAAPRPSCTGQAHWILTRSAVGPSFALD